MKIKAKQLDEIYAKLPKLRCQRRCQDSCGPILMSRMEWQRIIRETGRKPGVGENLACSLLCQDGTCSAYRVRPLICRLWGMVREMACPFGCEPERWLSDEEAGALLKKMRDLGGLPSDSQLHGVVESLQATAWKG